MPNGNTELTLKTIKDFLSALKCEQLVFQSCAKLEDMPGDAALKCATLRGTVKSDCNTAEIYRTIVFDGTLLGFCERFAPALLGSDLTNGRYGFSFTAQEISLNPWLGNILNYGYSKYRELTESITRDIRREEIAMWRVLLTSPGLVATELAEPVEQKASIEQAMEALRRLKTAPSSRGF